MATELAKLKEKSSTDASDSPQRPSSPNDVSRLTYAQLRERDGCCKRGLHRCAYSRLFRKLALVRDMGADMDGGKKKDGAKVDWKDFRSLQAYHASVIAAKVQKNIDAKTDGKLEVPDPQKDLGRPPSSAAISVVPGVAPQPTPITDPTLSLAPTPSSNALNAPPTTPRVVSTSAKTFMGDRVPAALTDDQARLIAGMFSDNSYELTKANCKKNLDFNFTAFVPGRNDAVTPLSILCRPELCNALKDVRDHPKEIAEGLQRNLVEYALSNGTMDKDIWKGNPKAIPTCSPMFANRRAISDSVYQGRVDLLRLLIEYFPEVKDILRHQMEFGSSYLHMAAHDGRTEMAIFLIDEVEVPVEVECTKDAPKTCRGQTPLFWCFARGVVNEKCAKALMDRGADPIRLWHATKKGVRLATLSPLSMALVTAPDFAERVLAQQRPRVGNRGLNLVFKPNFLNLMVDENGKTILFAPQIEVVKGTVWETFNYDHRPQTHRSLLQLMIDHKRKKLLQMQIMRIVLYVMWFEFGFQKFILDFGLFLVYVFNVSVSVGIFNAGVVWVTNPGTEPTAFIDQNERDWRFIIPLGISAAISFSLMAQEIRELRGLGRKYFGEIKNMWDLLSITLFWVMSYGMLTVYFADLSINSVIWGDAVIKGCNILLQVTFISGFLEFGAVPKISGPFVSMIWNMLTDVGRFFLMFVVFYLTFVAALWPMARDALDGAPAYRKIEVVMTLIFRWLVAGLDDTDITSDVWLLGENSELARIVFFIYAVVCSILLLNMLIAMMNNTYTLVQEDKEGEWCLNWARFMQYHLAQADEVSKHCVNTFLRENSGKTQEQSLAQVASDEEEKSWVDDVRDGVAILRQDLANLTEFVTRRNTGLTRVATVHVPAMYRMKGTMEGPRGSMEEPRGSTEEKVRIEERGSLVLELDGQ